MVNVEGDDNDNASDSEDDVSTSTSTAAVSVSDLVAAAISVEGTVSTVTGPPEPRVDVNADAVADAPVSSVQSPPRSRSSDNDCLPLASHGPSAPSTAHEIVNTGVLIDCLKGVVLACWVQLLKKDHVYDPQHVLLFCFAQPLKVTRR